MSNNRVFQEIIDHLYDKDLAGIDSTVDTRHHHINGVTYYSSRYDRLNDYQTIRIGDVELNRNGKLEISDYGTESRYLDVARFLSDARRAVVDGIEPADVSYLVDIDQKPERVIEKVETEKVVERRSESDIRNEGKVDVLNQIIERLIK